MSVCVKFVVEHQNYVTTISEFFLEHRVHDYKSVEQTPSPKVPIKATWVEAVTHAAIAIATKARAESVG